MSNPAIMEQAIASNPQLATMGPHVRETFQSPAFREMMYAVYIFYSSSRLFMKKYSHKVLTQNSSAKCFKSLLCYSKVE